MAPAVKSSVTKAKGRCGTPAGGSRLAEAEAVFGGLSANRGRERGLCRPQFPEEARKIHYGETEARHIYGESTMKEVQELIDEGIEIAPVPPRSRRPELVLRLPRAAHIRSPGNWLACFTQAANWASSSCRPRGCRGSARPCAWTRRAGQDAATRRGRTPPSRTS